MAKDKTGSHEIKSYHKKVTVKDLSNEVGVSVSTVERALNNKGRVSEATRRKVLEAAERLNYRKNEFARSLRIRKDIKILAIYPAKPKLYTKHFTAGFEEVHSELSDFGLHFDVLRADTLSPEDILEVAGRINVSDYDAVLLNAGGPELNSFISDTVKQGIPVATFNSDSPASQRLFYCGEYHYGAGMLCGELTAKMLRGCGTVSLFSGLPTVYALCERVRGFTDCINEDFPDVSVINEISHQDDPGLRFDKAEELLFSGEMPDAVFCNSATGALPVCSLIEKYKVKNRPVVIGYDEDRELESMLKKGFCTALIFQDPEQQARSVLRHMFQYLYDGKSLPEFKETSIIPTIVMRGNLELCSR